MIKKCRHMGSWATSAKNGRGVEVIKEKGGGGGSKRLESAPRVGWGTSEATLQ